jgi:hypothetical protein
MDEQTKAINEKRMRQAEMVVALTDQMDNLEAIIDRLYIEIANQIKRRQIQSDRAEHAETEAEEYFDAVKEMVALCCAGQPADGERVVHVPLKTVDRWAKLLELPD